MPASSRQFALLGPPNTSGDFTITTAGVYAGVPASGLDGMRGLTAQIALAWGSGGTTIDAYLQTSVDGGATWIDIWNVHLLTASAVAVASFFTDEAVAPFTPSDGALASNTQINGVLGNMLRLKLVTVGTYANTVVAGRIVVR
jgi:hypothetical protein